MKTYNYFIENLDNEKIEEIKEKIANLPFVKEVNITEAEKNLALSYSLGDNDDEYEVFVKTTEILQAEGADIAFEEEGEPIITQPKIVEELEEKGEAEEVIEQEVEPIKPKKKGFFSRIPDFTTRIAEIIVALLLFAFVDFSNYIAAGLCLVLASYEIFYETICDITKRRFTDNLCASLAVIFGALCGHLTGAFYFAVGFSILKILNSLALYLLKKKTEEHYQIKSFEDEFGEEVQVEDLKEGLVLNIADTVYFACEVVSGEAQVKKGAEIIEVKEGDLLDFGDKILNKKYLIVKCLENYSGSKLEKNREVQKRVSEQIADIKPSKKAGVIYFALIITGLIYCFISPLFFDGGYMYNLSAQGIKGVLVLALTAPIMELWTSVSREIFRFVVSKNVAITSFNEVENLYQIKTAFYNREVFNCEGKLHEHAYGMIREVKDLGIITQTAYGENEEQLNQTCDELKLKNRLVVNEQGLLDAGEGAIVLDKKDGKIFASVNGEEVFCTSEENLRAIPKVYSASKRAKLFRKLTRVLSGIIQVAILCLTCLAFLSFSSALIISLILIGLVGASNLLQLIEM